MSIFSKLFGKNKKDTSSNSESMSDVAAEEIHQVTSGNDIYWVGNNPADANSDDLFEQAKAYDLGCGVQTDKQKAARLYREAMNNGDKKAKHNLAMMYLRQEGGLTDMAIGIQMLQELADEGNAFSITNLADCYMNGKGVEKDVDKGLELYLVASDKGMGIASYSIGAYYINECHDLDKGLEYCEKASEQGFALAASILAQMYEQGMGVEKDIEKSLRYLKRAAELGDPVCQLKHGMLLYGNKMEEGMEWMMKSAQQNYPPALFIVGQEYLNQSSHLFTDPKHFDIGIGMIREASKQGVEKASKFLEYYGLENELNMDERGTLFYKALENEDKDAAQQVFQQMYDCCSLGDPIAQCIIGMGYYYGLFGMQDKEKGLQLIMDACDRDYPDALNTMGSILNQEERYDESFPYHKRSAEQGDMYGLHNLGNAYFYGRGVERDTKKAFSLWMKAAGLGNPDTYNTMGNMFLRGEYVEQNIQEAIKYYSFPASQPCTTQILAMKNLVKAYRLLGEEEKAIEWEIKLKDLEE